MERKLIAVSLFSGCGGFDWGAQQAGVEIIWANDNDPHAANAYRSIFPDVEFVEDDIRNITKIPSADILIGCYPCTGFSIAARRKWKDREERNLKADKNNFLYREFLRVIDIVQPKYLFVENVRGMTSAEGGWFYKQQVEGFQGKGYQVYPQWLNAMNYGVPQSRKRLFLVGIKDNVPEFEYEFPEATHGEGKLPFVSLGSAISGMPEWPEGEYCDISFHGHYLTRNRKRAWERPSYTIVAHSHHVPLHPMGDPMIFIEKDKWALQGDDNRRLSWRECAAIQELPIEIDPGGNMHNKYRVVGNAVPPQLAKTLIKPVVAYEKEHASNN